MFLQTTRAVNLPIQIKLHNNTGLIYSNLSETGKTIASSTSPARSKLFAEAALILMCDNRRGDKALCLTGPVPFPTFPVLVRAQQQWKQIGKDWLPTQKADLSSAAVWSRRSYLRQLRPEETFHVKSTEWVYNDRETSVTTAVRL